MKIEHSGFFSMQKEKKKIKKKKLNYTVVRKKNGRINN